MSLLAGSRSEAAEATATMLGVALIKWIKTPTMKASR